MNISTTDLQALVGPQLSALADLLDERARSSERPDTIADAETMCAGWSVRHVVAHMTMAARYDGPAFMAELSAVDGDFDRLSRTIADRDARRPFDELLDDLRSDTMARWAPPGGGPTGALTHAVIHSADITFPNTLPRSSSDDATLIVLDSLADGIAGRQFRVDVGDRTLRATDLAWSVGDGAEVVSRPASELVALLAGRAVGGLDLRS